MSTGAVAVTMLTPGGAQAAPVKCTIKSYTPAKFIVGASETRRTFSVSTSTGCKADTWKIKFDDALTLNAATGVTDLIIDPTKATNGFAGVNTVTVSAKSKTSGAARGTKDFNFYLQRRSTFGGTFNAGPEPAVKGDWIFFRGVLKRVSWGETPTYVPYGGRKVWVQFKAKGTKTFVNLKSWQSQDSGIVSANTRATKSGTYRLHYSGNSTTGAADSNADAVVVN